jgi:hypothetical protein
VWSSQFSLLSSKEFIMTATHGVQGTTKETHLHLAFELSWNQCKLAFTVGQAQPARLRTVAARDLASLTHVRQCQGRARKDPGGCLAVWTDRTQKIANWASTTPTDQVML